jgi:hypothetical protein
MTRLISTVHLGRKWRGLGRHTSGWTVQDEMFTEATWTREQAKASLA